MQISGTYHTEVNIKVTWHLIMIEELVWKYSRRSEGCSYPWNLITLQKVEEIAFLLPSLLNAEDLRYSKSLMDPCKKLFIRMIQLGWGSKYTDSWWTPHIQKFKNTKGGMRKSFLLLITEVGMNTGRWWSGTMSGLTTSLSNQQLGFWAMTSSSLQQQAQIVIPTWQSVEI